MIILVVLQITSIPVLKWTLYCTLRPRSRNFVKHAAAGSQMSPAIERLARLHTFGIIKIHDVRDLTTSTYCHISRDKSLFPKS